MSLRGNPVEEHAVLPDRRELRIWVGVPDDPYVKKRDMDTVVAELHEEDEVLATVTTVLAADDTSAARQLAGAIKEGLETGAWEPKAAAIEHLADRIAS